MTTEGQNAEASATRLLAWLRRLREDRGAMANLRCAVTPARRARAWPLLGQVGGIDRSIYESVAGLFAHHPEETDSGNLGTTCRRLAGENASFDARFRRLLGCDREEVCERLRPIVLAARSKGFPVNYRQLFEDLWYWGDRVKTRWAKEYWPPAETGEPPAVPAAGGQG